MARRRNKEQSIQMLIGAVGRILTEKGYPGIGINKVALEAKVSKPLIYDYFGNLNGLLKAYVHEKDYWLPYFETLELPEDPGSEDLKNLFIRILQDQFHYFRREKEMQKLILWQISEYHPLMRAVSESREAEGLKLLELPGHVFKDSGVSIKVVVALLVGGIYNFVLHNAAGTGSICGVEIDNEKDTESVIRTIAQVIEWAWQAAENK